MFTGYFRHTEWQEAVPSTVQYRTFDTPGALLQYNLRGVLGGLTNEFSAGLDFDGQSIDEIRRPNLGFGEPGAEVVADNPENTGGFNRDLVAATSSGIEAGVRGSLAPRLEYDVAVFYLGTEDDFGRYRIPDRPLETFYRNAGDSTRYGLETLLG